MLLRNQVEWALHCCNILHLLPKETYLSTKALAEFHGVPKEYLSKALQALSREGLLEKALGPNGGYRLAKASTDIHFLDVVEAIEGKNYMFKCTEIRKNAPCNKPKETFSSKCLIARVMHQADEAWRAQLAAVSLNDLAEMFQSELPEDRVDAIRSWIESYS